MLDAGFPTLFTRAKRRLLSSSATNPLPLPHHPTHTQKSALLGPTSYHRLSTILPWRRIKSPSSSPSLTLPPLAQSHNNTYIYFVKADRKILKHSSPLSPFHTCLIHQPPDRKIFGIHNTVRCKTAYSSQEYKFYSPGLTHTSSGSSTNVMTSERQMPRPI